MRALRATVQYSTDTCRLVSSFNILWLRDGWAAAAVSLSHHFTTSPLREISAVAWASSDGVFLASAGVMHAAVAAGAALLLLAALSAEVSMRFAHAHAHMRARGERDTTHTDTKAGCGQRSFDGTSGQRMYELFIKY